MEGDLKGKDFTIFSGQIIVKRDYGSYKDAYFLVSTFSNPQKTCGVVLHESHFYRKCHNFFHGLCVSMV